MGERNDAERSVREARERLSEVALELSRRTSGDYVKGKAKEAAREQTERAKVIARERTTEMKDRLLDSPWALGFIGGVVGTVAGRLIGAKAKESRQDSTFRRGTLPYDEYTATHRMGASGGYVGGYQGGYGSQQSYSGQGYYSNPYHQGYDASTGGSWAGGSDAGGYDYNASGYQEGDFNAQSSGFNEGESHDEGGGLKAKAQDAKERLREGVGSIREKAMDAKDRVQSKMHSSSGDNANFGEDSGPGIKDRMQERVQDLRGRAGHALHGARDRMPSGGDLRGRAQAVKHNADEHPGIWALAALAAGAFVGAVMPVTDKERQALAPIRARATEGIHGLQSQAREKVQTVADEVKHKAQSVADVAGVGGILGSSDKSERKDDSSDERSQQAFRQDSWNNKPGTTYHASDEGGSFGPSNVEPEVERTSPAAGYGGGSVGEDDQDKGWSASSSSDDDTTNRTIIANPDDDNLTRH